MKEKAKAKKTVNAIFDIVNLGKEIKNIYKKEKKKSEKQKEIKRKLNLTEEQRRKEFFEKQKSNSPTVRPPSGVGKRMTDNRKGKSLSELGTKRKYKVKAPGQAVQITEKEFGAFKLRSGNKPSPAKLMGVTRKPSVLKSNTDGVFDIMTKRKVKRTVKNLANEQVRKYKKLYRRAKKGDIEGIYKDQKRAYKKLFKSVKRIFN